MCAGTHPAAALVSAGTDTLENAVGGRGHAWSGHSPDCRLDDGPRRWPPTAALPCPLCALRLLPRPWVAWAPASSWPGA